MKEIVDEYRDYQQFVIMLLLHSFFSTFFCLWGLAADVFGKELVASKSFHGVLGLLVLHWRTVSKYSFLETSSTELKDAVPARLVRSRMKSEFRFHLKTALVFASLFLVDVLFASVRLFPVVVQCIRHRDSGEKLSKYCGGSTNDCEVLENEAGIRPDYATFYYLTVFATLGQAALELAVIVRAIIKIRQIG